MKCVEGDSLGHKGTDGDMVSRKAAIDTLLHLSTFDTREELVNYCDASVADTEGRMGAIAECLDAIDDLPEATQKIDYRFCADAMLMMWLEEVLTNGEYCRIMDKLNRAHKDGQI